jgi:hypothetical protein
MLRRTTTYMRLIRRRIAGMLRVPGVMPPKCKMFDTPGVPHNFQLTSRLTADEVSACIFVSVCADVYTYNTPTC